jgi:hypothetical protein
LSRMRSSNPNHTLARRRNRKVVLGRSDTDGGDAVGLASNISSTSRELHCFRRSKGGCDSRCVVFRVITTSLCKPQGRKAGCVAMPHGIVSIAKREEPEA